MSSWRGGGCAAAFCVCALALALPGESGASLRFEINAVPAPKRADPPKMHRGGIDTARFNFNWSFIEQSQGSFNWASTDRIVGRLARGGVRSAPILIGTPGWLASSPLHPPLDSRRARSAWREFLRRAVGRYGPGGSFWSAHTNLHRRPIRTWEVWNEPNYPASWDPRPSARSYARLLEISRHAIRSRDAHARIVLAGLGPGHSGAGKIAAPEFLRGLYRHGAGHLFDVAAANAYAATAHGDERKIAAFARVAHRHHTPTWVTEVGWSSSRSPGHVWAAGSKRHQARLEARLFAWLEHHHRRLGVVQVYWYDWRDMRDPHTGRPTYDFGLRAPDGNPKPAWRVFTRFAR